MPTINDQLARILQTVCVHGSFYATGTSEIGLPNMEVDGVGRIALPLLPVQAAQLIAVATRAPFGRGEQTIIDTTVRRTWQIGAEKVRLTGRNWPRTLGDIVAQAVDGLGVTAEVSAELYKLLVYDTGSFFTEHRDTEKSPGMFATLVVVLPSDSGGGELIIRHKGQEVCLDLNPSEPADVAFAAFYADCVHEVRPVTSGCRLALIYNLVRKDKGQMPTLPNYATKQADLADLLRNWAAASETETDSPIKLIYPLAHAYTPAELGFHSLKNADAAAAAVAIAAAKDADCALHLALVSIVESGTAEYCGHGGGGGRYDDYDDGYGDEDDFEIGEIFESDLRVSDWRLPDGSAPPIGELPFYDEELCPLDVFADQDPDEQEFQGSTGNEGASIERRYRRVALVFWPNAHRLAVINQGGLALTLPYLKDLATRWADGGGGVGRESSLWCEAHALAGHMLGGWSKSGGYGYCPAGDASGAAAMLSALTLLRDTERIAAFLAEVSTTDNYRIDDNAAMVRAALPLAPARTAELVGKVIAANAQRNPRACANLLARVAAEAGFAAVLALFQPAAAILVETLLNMPDRPAQNAPWRPRPPIETGLIEDLFTALHKIGAEALAERLLAHVLACPHTYPMDALLVPAALALTESETETAGAAAKTSASVQRLRAACLAHLRARIAQPLVAPADFARAGVLACKCANCTNFSNFLADATRGEWVLKAVEDVRRHLEESIEKSACDVDCVTSKVHRPYSLVCKKNQNSYAARVRQRQGDLANLARLEVD